MTPEELKKIRSKMGKTQNEMAGIIGVSVSGYRKWEQGHRGIKGVALKVLKGMVKEV